MHSIHYANGEPVRAIGHPDEVAVFPSSETAAIYATGLQQGIQEFCNPGIKDILLPLSIRLNAQAIEEQTQAATAAMKAEESNG